MTSIHTSAILIITDDRILVHYMIKNWPEKNVIQIITIKILTGQRVRRITNKNRYDERIEEDIDGTTCLMTTWMRRDAKVENRS